MNARRLKLISIGAFCALVVFAGLIGFSMIRQLTSGEKPLPTSIAVPPARPPREVKDVLTTNDGDLIITYTDGTEQNAGRVVGKPGDNGLSQEPNQAQISAAIIEYCAGGRCDSKTPTQAQILEAIASYCAGGICRGQSGQDAAPITAEQILAAVTAYCADGRCRGADGQSITGPAGPQGERGDSTVMSCVMRQVNATSVRYVSWKYASEPDAAYRDIYKLPAWAECTNPVDLTGGGA